MKEVSSNVNISKWSKETSLLIKKIVKKNEIILVGSSMGSWISLVQFQYFKKQIKGFLGIGSAPEFLERLMWNKFTKKEKREIKKRGIINLKHGDYEYPITFQLIQDGRKNKVLHKKIYQKINVTMIHGSKDESVPVSYSKKVLKMFKNAKSGIQHTIPLSTNFKILKYFNMAASANYLEVWQPKTIKYNDYDPSLGVAVKDTISGLKAFRTYSYGLSLATNIYGTLSVNILGSFLIGYFITSNIFKNFSEDFIRFFLVIGLLGSFTTFSAFSYEALSLVMEKKIIVSIIYIFFSISVCILSAYLGILINK